MGNSSEMGTRGGEDCFLAPPFFFFLGLRFFFFFAAVHMSYEFEVQYL